MAQINIAQVVSHLMPENLDSLRNWLFFCTNLSSDIFNHKLQTRLTVHKQKLRNFAGVSLPLLFGNHSRAIGLCPAQNYFQRKNKKTDSY